MTKHKLEHYYYNSADLLLYNNLLYYYAYYNHMHTPEHLFQLLSILLSTLWYVTSGGLGAGADPFELLVVYAERVTYKLLLRTHTCK